jgi:hypothetical protein
LCTTSRCGSDETSWVPASEVFSCAHFARAFLCPEFFAAQNNTFNAEKISAHDHQKNLPRPFLITSNDAQ